MLVLMATKVKCPKSGRNIDVPAVLLFMIMIVIYSAMTGSG